MLFRRTRVIDINSSVQLVERQENAALQIVIAPWHAFLRCNGLFGSLVRHPTEEIRLLMFWEAGVCEDLLGGHRIS